MADPITSRGVEPAIVLQTEHVRIIGPNALRLARFFGLFRNLGAESVIWNSSKTQSDLFVLCWSGDGTSPKPFAVRFARSQRSCVGVYFG